MKEPLPLNDSLDTFTAARVAKVTEATMRRWCEEGRIRAWKPGGRWRIEMVSLHQLIAAGQNSGHRAQNRSQYKLRLDLAVAALDLSADHLKAVAFAGPDDAIEAAFALLRDARRRFVRAKAEYSENG